MIIPINSSQISKLIPAVGTGSQFKYSLGNPRKILQRVIVSSIGGFISLIISSTGDQTNNFWLFLCVGFFLYIIWGPILESSRKNLQLRKYKFFSLFDGYVSDIYKTERIESNKPVGPDPTILKLNLLFIRLYKYQLFIQVNIANFLECWP